MMIIWLKMNVLEQEFIFIYDVICAFYSKKEGKELLKDEKAKGIASKIEEYGWWTAQVSESAVDEGGSEAWEGLKVVF